MKTNFKCLDRPALRSSLLFFLSLLLAAVFLTAKTMVDELLAALDCVSW